MIQIKLISAEELAKECGYDKASNAFRQWCSNLKITPVPGRRGFFDPALVRQRLDEAQGLTVPPEMAMQAVPGSLVQRRRERLGRSE